MAVTVFPVDAVAGAPSYTGRMLREAMSVYLAGASAADPFGCVSGVRAGTSSTTVTATSTTWTVGAHAGVLDMEPAVEASGYAYAINATGGLPTGAVTAADATRPRVDIVWVRLDDPAESDGSSVPAVVAGYTAGAPNATPAAPATPARCMVLATLQVPMSGGGSPTVIWVAPTLGAAPGGRVIRDGTAFTTPANVWQPLSSYLTVVDQPALGIAPISSGMWTITTPGVYDVEAGFHTMTAAITLEFIVKKNSIAADVVGTVLADSTTTTAVGGAASVKGRIRLNAGDTLISAVRTSAAAVWSTPASNYEGNASFFGLRYVEPLR